MSWLNQTHHLKPCLDAASGQVFHISVLVYVAVSLSLVSTLFLLVVRQARQAVKRRQSIVSMPESCPSGSRGSQSSCSISDISEGEEDSDSDYAHMDPEMKAIRRENRKRKASNAAAPITEGPSESDKVDELIKLMVNPNAAFKKASESQGGQQATIGLLAQSMFQIGGSVAAAARVEVSRPRPRTTSASSRLYSTTSSTSSSRSVSTSSTGSFSKNPRSISASSISSTANTNMSTNEVSGVRRRSLPGHRRPSVTFNPTLLEVVHEQESPRVVPHSNGSLSNILEEEANLRPEVKESGELNIDSENADAEEGGDHKEDGEGRGEGGRQRKHGVFHAGQLARNSISEMRM